MQLSNIKYNVFTGVLFVIYSFFTFIYVKNHELIDLTQQFFSMISINLFFNVLIYQLFKNKYIKYNSCIFISILIFSQILNIYIKNNIIMDIVLLLISLILIINYKIKNRLIIILTLTLILKFMYGGITFLSIQQTLNIKKEFYISIINSDIKILNNTKRVNILEFETKEKLVNFLIEKKLINKENKEIKKEEGFIGYSFFNHSDILNIIVFKKNKLIIDSNIKPDFIEKNKNLYKNFIGIVFLFWILFGLFLNFLHENKIFSKTRIHYDN